MLIKFFYTIFVLCLNYIIYKKVNEGKLNKNYLIGLIVYGLSIFIFNYVLNTLPNKLIIFLLFFSFSIIVLNILKGLINVYEKSELVDEEKITKFKFIMLNVILPITITIYQILIIWSDGLLNKMINK
jgi:hypothetical protein